MLGTAAGLVSPALGAAAFVPVTDAMLDNPAPSDWLMVSRTYDQQRFSPLDQINTSNANQLRMAWARSLPLGTQESTPIVYRGVMYLFAPGATIQAAPLPKVMINIEYYGNTTAGTIPLATRDAIAQGRLKKGDIVFLPRWRRTCQVHKVDKVKESVVVDYGNVKMEVPFEDVSWLPEFGVSYHVGREANSVYGESWNGVQVGVLHHRHHFGVLKTPVDPYVVPGDPKTHQAIDDELVAPILCTREREYLKKPFNTSLADLLVQ